MKAAHVRTSALIIVAQMVEAWWCPRCSRRGIHGAQLVPFLFSGSLGFRECVWSLWWQFAWRIRGWGSARTAEDMCVVFPFRVRRACNIFVNHLLKDSIWKRDSALCCLLVWFADLWNSVLRWALGDLVVRVVVAVYAHVQRFDSVIFTLDHSLLFKY